MRHLAGEYSRHFIGLQRLLTAYRPIICPFDLLVDAVPTESTVLDIGCGSGLFLFLLSRKRQIKNAVGIDRQESVVDAGRRAIWRTGLRTIELQVAKSVLNWPGAKWDVVTMIDVMHHVPPGEQRTVFFAACERVKPGGRFVYKDMCRSPRWRAWVNRIHDLVVARQWIHYVPIETIDKWALEAGLRPIEKHRIDMLVYGHEVRVYERQ